MKKIFVSIAAVGVLAIGAFAASTIADGQAFAQTADDSAVERPDIPKPGDILDEVLSDLVADETLDQRQADAVKAELEARHAEARAQHAERRDDHPGRPGHGVARGFDMGGLMEDGVIDSDELAELPDDHPFRDTDGPAARFLDDGELSEDELSDLGEQLRERRFDERSNATNS